MWSYVDLPSRLFRRLFCCCLKQLTAIVVDYFPERLIFMSTAAVQSSMVPPPVFDTLLVTSFGMAGSCGSSVPASTLILELPERLLADGSIDRQMDVMCVRLQLAEARRLGCEQLLIASMHTDLYPQHLKALHMLAKELGFAEVGELAPVAATEYWPKVTVNGVVLEQVAPQDIEQSVPVVIDRWRYDCAAPDKVENQRFEMHLRARQSLSLTLDCRSVIELWVMKGRSLDGEPERLEWPEPVNGSLQLELLTGDAIALICDANRTL